MGCRTQMAGSREAKCSAAFGIPAFHWIGLNLPAKVNIQRAVCSGVPGQYAALLICKDTKAAQKALSACFGDTPPP